MAKKTIEEVRKYFEEKNLKLLSTEYKNVDTDLEYICPKHEEMGIQHFKFRNSRTGRGCPCCMYEQGLYVNKVPWLIIKNQVEETGLIYKGTYSENEKSYIEFICPKHEELRIQSQNYMNFRKGKTGCIYCNNSPEGAKQLFTTKLKEIFDGNIIPLNKYKGARQRIKVKCIKHNYEWEPLVYNLLSGCGCPLCGNEIAGNKVAVGKEKILERLKSCKDISVITPITDSTRMRDNIKCKCDKCGKIWITSITNLTKDDKPTGCPHCNLGKTEKRMLAALDKLGLRYTPQKIFCNCKDVNVLPFDAYLDDFNVALEYDGEQHYKIIDRHKDKEKSQEDFIMTQKHDNIKNEYCKANNIPLIRIPYWLKDDLEYYLLGELGKLGVIEVRDVVS